MGRPSDRRRSAQRPGKRERARAKKERRSAIFVRVPGAGHVLVKAGRKKFRRLLGRSLSHLSVSHNSERGGTQGDGQATSQGASFITAGPVNRK